jgi:hypothetical protein
MSGLAAACNGSGFSRFLNGPGGRIFRIVAGIGCLILGRVFREHLVGVLSLVWSIFPLSAGVFDIGYISAVLGGPISGHTIRSAYQSR